MNGLDKPFSYEMSRKVHQLLDGRGDIKVLEAGCGSASHIAFWKKVQWVGIDTSKDELERNEFIQEKIHGDIQTYPLPREEFDAAICWDVLEHVAHPQLALLNIIHSIKDSGVLILAFPNVISLKGLVTKCSPYWSHKLYYRMMGLSKNPFHTYLRLSMRPAQIRKVALAHGFSVEFDRLYDGAENRLKKNVLLFILFRFASFLLTCLTFRKIDFALSECLFVFRKTKPVSV